MVKIEYVDGDKECFEKISKQRKLKTRFIEAITKEELLRLVTFNKELSDDVKMFVFLTFLTGGRRNEVLNIRKMDLTREIFKTEDGKEHEIIIFNMINEKSKTVTEKKIPIIRGLNTAEDYMLDFILEKAKEKQPQDFLISLNNKHYTLINHYIKDIKVTCRYRDPSWPIRKEVWIKFGMFPHYLRHLRASDLAGLGIHLVNWMGWSRYDARLHEIYVRRDWKKLAQIQLGLVRTV